MNTVDPAVIEFANDTFYMAFNNWDLRQMSDLWALDFPCVCIHPGWAPLLGRKEVLESWETIFAGQEAGLRIVCHSPRVFPLADLYSVICYEQLSAGWLVATNIFVMEAGNIRLVHHQASQCMEPPEIDVPITTVQ